MTVQVVGAVIIANEKVLGAQRGPGRTLEGLWEFPGGKIDPGEAPDDAVVREIQEELGCQITVLNRIITVSHAYEFATIELTTFYASLTDGVPFATEHSALRWIAIEELRELEWAPADLPTVDLVIRDHNE